MPLQMITMLLASEVKGPVKRQAEAETALVSNTYCWHLPVCQARCVTGTGVAHPPGLQEWDGPDCPEMPPTHSTVSSDLCCCPVVSAGLSKELLGEAPRPSLARATPALGFTDEGGRGWTRPLRSCSGPPLPRVVWMPWVLDN